VTDALLLVDVLKDFRHEDGDALLESYRRRHPALVSLLEDARARGAPVVYANDRGEHTAPGDVVREAIEEGKAGGLVAEVAPAQGETVVLKDAYSAFQATGLSELLAGLVVEKVLGGGRCDRDVRLPDGPRCTARGIRSGRPRRRLGERRRGT